MWLSILSMIALMIFGCLLIFIILLQRGRGGGLAGAFGGLGGQSAFGTKAGDVFTKITVVLAVLWVALAGLSGYALRADASRRYTVEPPANDSVGPSETEVPIGTADPLGDEAATDEPSPETGDAPAGGPSLQAPAEPSATEPETNTPDDAETDTADGDQPQPE